MTTNTPHSLSRPVGSTNVSWPADRTGHEQIQLDLRGLAGCPLDALRVMIVGDIVRRLHECAGNQVTTMTLQDGCARTTCCSNLVQDLGVQLNQNVEQNHSNRTDNREPYLVIVTPNRLHHSATDERIVPIGPVTSPVGEKHTRDRLHGHEPLAAKLALLRFPPTQPAELTAARLRRATRTLDRWRRKMSDWKDQPAAASPDSAILRELFTEALRTDRVLRAMHRIEVDHTVASGAKYSIFTAVDDILALDLHRKCGLGLWWHN